jgi:hypothetical protein
MIGARVATSARRRAKAARLGEGRLEGERGASLVLAIAFLGLFSVFIVALLGFAQAAFLSTVGVHEQGLRQYAASSAVDTAIQRVRANIDLGRDPAFGGPSCDLSYPAVGDAPAVSVTCAGQPGSGDVQPGTDAPPNAILTLATTGVGIDNTKNGTLYVQGPIFSNADIRLHNPGQPKLDATDMPITARGNCGDTLSDWTYGELRCNFTGVDPDGDDPGYPSRLGELGASLPAPNPVPTCLGSGSGRTIAYSPGYYTNVAVLTQTVSGCSNAPRWFQPGVYYFDFDFDPAFSNPVWTITDRIIGGTPKGWTPGSSAPGTPPPQATASTTCQAPGVQFVFGGGSRVVLGGSAVVELCASQLAGPGGRIAIYGQRTGAASTSTFTRSPTGASATPATFAPASNVLPIGANPSPIDGQVATGTASAPGPSSTITMSMSGYPGVPAPPVGAVAVSYALHVAHREQSTGGGNNNVESLQVRVGSCAIDVPVRAQPALATDVVTAPCLQGAVTGTFTVDYVATARNGRSFTTYLDGVQLVASYIPAVPRAQDAGGEPLIANNPGSGNTPTFYVWGTVYTPNGDLNIDFKNNATIAFDRGVIVRRLIVAAVPSTDTRGAFRLGTGGRLVEFVATTSDGVERLRALVRFVDTSSTPGRITRVQRWSVRR